MQQLLLLLLLPVAVARYQSCLAAVGFVDVSTSRQLLLTVPSSSAGTIVRQNDAGAGFDQFEGRPLQFSRQVTCPCVPLGT